MSERDRKYYLKNKAKIRAANDAWAKAHPEEMRGYKRKWKELNRERLRIESLERYHKNPEPYLRRNKEWVKNNPERHRANGRKHDAKPHRKVPRGDYKARRLKWYLRHLEKARAGRIAYIKQSAEKTQFKE